jgi:hypothetical protein
MLHCHLAMADSQSAAVISQSDNHELAKALPHVLGHPRTTVPQSSIALTPKWSTQSGKTITSCRYIPRAFQQQSSFMSVPSVVTTWRTIYLHRLKHPRTFQSDLRPRLHRSGPPGLINHPPHASLSSCDGRSAICGGDFTK